MTIGQTMGGNQSGRMQSGVWLTPRRILDPLGRFDLDPCAAPNPELWPTATRHIALPDDGLTADWTGRVWLNPPYNIHARDWLARLADHGFGTALTFARTDTGWFADHVWNQANALLFLRGRVRFHLPDGQLARDNGGAPSVLAAYGPIDAAYLSAAAPHLGGKYITLR